MNEELKILVVDDFEVDLLFVRSKFRSLGIFNQIDTARSIKELLFMCSEYDLILLDVFLGGQNSLDYFDEIRATTKAPIFIYSGSAEEMKKQAFDKGASWVLSKPLDPINLIQAILTLKIGSLRLFKNDSQKS